MNPAELYEIFYAAQEAIDRILQFVITISFAVIIASYLASSRINGFLYTVIALVYTVTFAALMSRMSLHISKSEEFTELLIKQGEEFLDIDSFLSVMGPLSGILMYLSTLGFLYYWHTKRDDT